MFVGKDEAGAGTGGVDAIAGELQAVLWCYENVLGWCFVGCVVRALVVTTNGSCARVRDAIETFKLTKKK